MATSQRNKVAPHWDSNPSPETPVQSDTGVKPLAGLEEISNDKIRVGWDQSRAGGGDTAMLLISDPDAVSEEVDPTEAKKLERRIDFMILPYLAVCHAFFYIDKTTLSYAAIFNIREDLNLKGTQYNWLSSIFYFGFLAWAFPTNFLMQRLPIGRNPKIWKAGLRAYCSPREISWGQYICVVGQLDTQISNGSFIDIL